MRWDETRWSNNNAEIWLELTFDKASIRIMVDLRALSGVPSMWINIREAMNMEQWSNGGAKTHIHKIKINFPFVKGLFSHHQAIALQPPWGTQANPWHNDLETLGWTRRNKTLISRHKIEKFYWVGFEISSNKLDLQSPKTNWWLTSTF